MIDTSSLKKFSASLRNLPKVVAQKAAAAAAPAITDAARATFDASQDPYGVPWAPGHDGGKVDLDETGALKRQVHYVAIGTRLRVALGVPYAKYQIGRRPVYPRQGDALPTAYTKAIETAVGEVIRTELGQ